MLPASCFREDQSALHVFLESAQCYGAHVLIVLLKANMAAPMK